MELQEFVNKCENNVIKALELRESLSQKTAELSEMFKEILALKYIVKDCMTKKELIKEIRNEKEKTEVEIIRTKQMKAKEDARSEKFEEIFQNVMSSIQKGVSDKDEMVTYQNHLKNYFIRRITGVNINMEETSSNGKISGWITNLPLATFEVFECDTKSNSNTTEFLWNLNWKMDNVSNDNWNQIGLFGDD